MDGILKKNGYMDGQINQKGQDKKRIGQIWLDYMDAWIDPWIDRQIECLIDRSIDRQIGRQIDRQIDR